MTTNTVQQMQSQVEVWHNTAAGMRWYTAFDLRGQEISKTVEGNRTFTLTTFERQLNQGSAGSPEQDLFRNGTFVLKKGGVDTEAHEITSTNAMTDSEVDVLVREMVHGALSPDEAIKSIDSIITLQRILEVMVIEDAKASAIAIVKKKRDKLTPGKPVERTVVSTKPEVPAPVKANG